MSEELTRHNLVDIRKAIDVLFRDVKFGGGECIEVRMFDKKKRGTVCGWFDDPAQMANAVARLARDGHGKDTFRHIHDNVYWTINPASDALLSRQPANKIDIATETTSDNNITRRLWLPVDIDPLRPSGVSATNEERKLALNVANTLSEELTKLGFPENCLVGGTSGNGYHLLLRCDLPNDDDSRDLIKRCLAAMQEMAGTSKAEIDPKVFNASRILKSYGTLSCKGMNTEERPWRWSKLTIIPETVTVADRSLLEKLAALAPEKSPRRNLGTNDKRKGPWDEENTQEFIDWTGWECREVTPSDSKNVRKWVGTCINDDNHQDSALMLFDNGWWAYTCFHASCNGTGHKEFKEYWEAENKEKYPSPGFDKPTVSGSIASDEFRAILDMPEAVGSQSIQCFNLTDAGNMERLVRRYGSGFRYCPERNWFYWDGKRWVVDNVGKIFRAALDTVRHIHDEKDAHWEQPEPDSKGNPKPHPVITWAKRSESRNSLTAMEGLAQSARGMALPLKEFDRDSWLFNCDNGTLDLRTSEFREHSELDLITKISPVVYNPNFECPKWEAFLSDIMADNKDNIAFLQRAMGYSLTGSTSEHCMFLLWGSGRNGKSTFLEVVRHIAGQYATAATMDLFLKKTFAGGIPNDLAGLQGARFVSATETEEGRQLDEPKIKQITGGDTISARFLHKEFFEFVPEFKIWLATNHRPVIVGQDEGIWRRIRLIPFTVTIPDGKVDENLREKLVAESSGILNWALRGLESFRKDGLMEPQAVIDATDSYRAEEDWLSAFLDAETVKVTAGLVQAKHLYERYRRWAEAAKEKVYSERKFNEHLTMRGIEFCRKDNRKFYQGISLRSYSYNPPASDMDELMDSLSIN